MRPVLWNWLPLLLQNLLLKVKNKKRGSVQFCYNNLSYFKLFNVCSFYCVFASKNKISQYVPVYGLNYHRYISIFKRLFKKYLTVSFSGDFICFQKFDCRLHLIFLNIKRLNGTYNSSKCNTCLGKKLGVVPL